MRTRGEDERGLDRTGGAGQAGRAGDDRRDGSGDGAGAAGRGGAEGDARARSAGRRPPTITVADETTRDTLDEGRLIEYARALGGDERLAEVDDTELARRVRCGAAELAAATARWLELLAELVVRGVWAQDGARTPSQWLSWAVGMAPSTAREHVRVALRLRECPLVAARFREGTLSYSKVRAITRLADPSSEPLLVAYADAAPAAVLERIVADARRLRRASSEPTARDDLGLTRRWRDDGTYEVVLRVDAATGIEVEQSIDRLVETAAPPADSAPGTRAAESDPTRDGRAIAAADEDDGHGDDDGPDDDGRDGTSVADAGVVTATDHPPTRRYRSQAGRAADAVLDALRAAVAAGPVDTSGEDRHLVVVHTTATELLAAAGPADDAGGDRSEASGEFDRHVGSLPARPVEAEADAGSDVQPDGRTGVAVAASAGTASAVHDGRGRTRVTAPAHLWRLARSARVQVVVDGPDGSPVGLGRTRRDPDARLRRLLVARDRSCRFPGCGATRHLHAHHVVWWSHGGPTDLDNLVLLCRRHHALIHDEGWVLRGDGPGRWTFHAPDDRPSLRHDQTRPEMLPLGPATPPHHDARTPVGDTDQGASAEHRQVRLVLTTIVGAARAHERSLTPPDWDGSPYDHDLTVGLLTERLDQASAASRGVRRPSLAATTPRHPGSPAGRPGASPSPAGSPARAVR